jgi:hypothetical protein
LGKRGSERRECRQSAAEDVNSADFEELFSELSMQRQQFATELQTP